MIITITGPRSVGKSTISKLVAKTLRLKYVSSDEIGEKAFEKYGGLDKAIKLGVVENIIKKGGYNLILNQFKEDNFVFDLSGGSINSKKMEKASKQVRKIAKEKSIIFGLLPYENNSKSIKLLFSREQKRIHFKEKDKKELLKRTKKDYPKFLPIFKKFCDYIVFTKDKSPKKISNEIVRLLK